MRFNDTFVMGDSEELAALARGAAAYDVQGAGVPRGGGATDGDLAHLADPYEGDLAETMFTYSIKGAAGGGGGAADLRSTASLFNGTVANEVQDITGLSAESAAPRSASYSLDLIASLEGGADGLEDPGGFVSDAPQAGSAGPPEPAGEEEESAREMPPRPTRAPPPPPTRTPPPTPRGSGLTMADLAAPPSAPKRTNTSKADSVRSTLAGAGAGAGAVRSQIDALERSIQQQIGQQEDRLSLSRKAADRRRRQAGAKKKMGSL